ncbi:isopeptide-forming domain-containing fimbrial protein [bacterium]|nr:isopeptide-forming domain-containing fimbrial protein [bacterium]
MPRWFLIASRLPKGAIYQIIVFPVLRLLFLFLLTVGLARPGFAQILFDATKAETAGNADWVIDADSAGNPQRIPTPTISAINASTAESYWKGGISSWGVALAKLRNAGQITLGGNGIETLSAGASITYGNASNAQDLSHYQAYVVCEPNTLFTAAEKTAILNYVKNGGCLFMIADHSSSDRNNDGYDSLQVWNDLMTNNSVQTNPFGFSFNSYSGSPTAVLNSAASDPLTHGAAGTATQFVFNVGTTMTITNTSTTHASVWQTSPTKVMALYGTYGSGRFVAIGDSSPVDDGTGASGDTLYDGWNSPAGNAIVALNGTLWLLANSTATVIAPTVTTDAATSLLSNGAALNATVNPNGAATTVTFSYGLTTAYGTTASVAGSLAGASAQAASATITGLSAGTVYHYRASAVNSAGTVNGADRTFTTAAAALPDLTLAKTHTSLFRQGLTGLTYTLTATNSGAAATAGPVTVVDTLPVGLTATALTGTGWTVNLGTLTATRSDALAAASSYPPVTVTVKVAVNAAASVTNTATVSGGGEANTADNLASDPTPITALAPIEAWRFANFGTIALTPDTADTAIVAGDGLPNLLKYALGLDPHIPAVTGIITDTTTGCLRLSVSLNPNASDITCQVEVTSTLEDNASWTTDGTSIDLSTPSFLQVSDGISLGDGVRRFMRLRVTRP